MKRKSLKRVIEATKKVLTLDDGVVLRGRDRFCSLEKDAMYVLEVFAELGIPYTNYTSGGAVSEKARDIFTKLAIANYSQGSRRYRHILWLGNPKKTPDAKALAGNLTLADIALIAEYPTTNQGI